MSQRIDSRRPSDTSANQARRADRRRFLAALSTAAVSGGALSAGMTAPASADEPDGELPADGILDSPPVLQNPAADGMTVAWAVRGRATGWVEYGETPELGRRTESATHGLNPISERFLSARLENLPAGKPFHYRVVSVPIDFRNAYNIGRGEPQAGPIYKARTLDPDAAEAGFAVLNDTHEHLPTLQAVTGQLAEEPEDFTVWNGDIFNSISSDDQIVAQTLRPADSAYAAERPVLFTCGNHDVRGIKARELVAALTPWPEAGPLGRCFAVRQGPLALIGLDTGEDKPDHHPIFSGLANFEPYREAQGEWLRQVLARPEIASAPFVVAFCHIPLWGLPGHNPGNTLQGYAYFSRDSQQAWHPALEEAGVQLLICAHMHSFRYDEPNEKHSYGQLVGGGPRPEQATLMRARANADRLEVTVYNLEKQVLGSWSYAPRAV